MISFLVVLIGGGVNELCFWVLRVSQIFMPVDLPAFLDNISNHSSPRRSVLPKGGMDGGMEEEGGREGG